MAEHADTTVARHHKCGNVTPVGTPIYATSTYLLADAQHGADLCLQNELQPGQSPYLYSRWSNPTTDVAANILTQLEGAAATIMASSGMAAISTVLLGLLKTGDHVVMSNCVYSGTYEVATDMLRRFGVDVTLVDSRDIQNYRNAIRPNTTILYGETPANPTLAVMDLKAFGGLGQEKGLITIVDSTFASPFNQRVFEFGVDISLHSATKYLGGHSDLLGGAICMRTKEHYDAIWQSSKLVGGVPSAFDSFLLIRGMKTLAVRMRGHNENALQIATFLEAHPAVESVFYPGLPSHPDHAIAVQQMSPGFGGMIAFEVKGGSEPARIFVESLNLINLAVSLGGVESLVEHAVSMTHTMVPKEEREAAGITDGLVRLSVGLEYVGDLIADLRQALAIAHPTSSL